MYTLPNGIVVPDKPGLNYFGEEQGLPGQVLCFVTQLDGSTIIVKQEWVSEEIAKNFRVYTGLDDKIT